MSNFESAFTNKLIYVFSIDDEQHKCSYKIGDASIKLTDEQLFNLSPNCSLLNKAAKKRIEDYTKTAGISFNLEYTELAIRRNKYNTKIFEYFRDYDVRKVLYYSGIKKKKIGKANEWVNTNLPTIINAIKATKANKKSLSSNEIINNFDEIIFRPEQKEAIKKTLNQFNTKNEMLWNAKMRFGKTLSALRVVQIKNYKKTLIITHRPIVKESWREDFYKIFSNNDEVKYYFTAKENDGRQDIFQLEECLQGDCNFIHFASIQDLRGSEIIGGNFSKNNLIFKTNWDMIIIDEAHEGTLTKLGSEVKNALIKKNSCKKTKVLYLSGTPFNLIDNFAENQIYTWDYVMEQKAKQEWDEIHELDTNPYDNLPKLEIYTYDLGEKIKGFIQTEDKAFNFSEFFRTWTGFVEKDYHRLPNNVSVGNFVHEKEVNSLLNLLTDNSNQSNYPFSNNEYRTYFRHTLWMLPGVKEAKALSQLLQKHKVFGSGAFSIVNVAGDGDEENASSDALEKVNKAITNNPENTYTITLSCGRLTTGVSIKPWTAVLMLSGSYSTSASNYLQTIFRVQTPANINGKMKDKCYVFDFAPDRTLKMVADARKLGSMSNQDSSKRMGEFLNFCPVIAINGSKMKPYNVNDMLQQLKKAYVDKVVLSGFSDSKLYNDELLKLDSIDIEEFNKLKQITKENKLGQSKDIVINNMGLTQEEYDELTKIKRKPKKELSKEDKDKVEALNKAKKERTNAIQILRAISIRIPMLIYGMASDFDKEISINQFIEQVDDNSWEEFMPKGITKEIFKKFKKYYDEDIFIAAGKQLRAKIKGSDELCVLERIKRITDIFNTFKNPDKETVLTPWRVVNMQMSDCLGGYDYYDESYNNLLDIPRFVDQGLITSNTIKNNQSKILEINSKSGLYALYIAYSIFKVKCNKYNDNELTSDLTKSLWLETIEKNVFIICKTPMAKQITKRTLLGYQENTINIHYFEDFISHFKNQSKSLVNKISRANYWNKGEIGKMKFDAIVGNPPYQKSDAGNSSGSSPVYPYFFLTSKLLKPDYISMIMPSRWFAGGKGLDTFREENLNDTHIEKIIDFVNAKDCFKTVSISGGVCYILWNKNHNDKCKFTNIYNGNKSTMLRFLNEFNLLVRYNEAIQIIRKIDNEGGGNIVKYIYPRNPFGLSSSERGSTKQNNFLKLFSSAGIGYISNNRISTGLNLINKYKLMMSKATAEHAGEPSKDGKFKVVSRTEILSPKEICTDSYLIVYSSDNQQEIINYHSYVKTKFYRFLLLQAVSSINLSRDKFIFIPEQNFEKEWTDELLYKKYNLTENEIYFIENMMKKI